jgi:general secretion pathway protein G
MFKRSAAKVILSSQKGMSLIEILIALTLLAVGGTFVSLNVFDRLTEGQVKSTKIQIGNLGKILKEYRRKCGTYPSTEQGLESLVQKPTGGKECKKYPPNGFLDGKIPMDPWDEEFIYESDGRKFTISSYGPDREEGGEETDADISSADL